MKLYKVSWPRTNSTERMYGEVYASNKDIAFNALGLDSMEWSKAEYICEYVEIPKEGQVAYIGSSDLDYLDEEEW